jgi:hypothetical protein
MSRLEASLRQYFEPERRAWRGDMALSSVFWGYGVGTSAVLAVLHATALDQGQLLFQQILVLASAAYTAWIVVAIWRSAANAAPFWGSLARWLTVAWALNSGLVLFFLQIDLMLRFMEAAR